jgi:hypothetical protein
MLGIIGGIGRVTVRGNHPVKIEAEILKSWEADRREKLLGILSGDVLGMEA